MLWVFFSFKKGIISIMKILFKNKRLCIFVFLTGVLILLNHRFGWSKYMADTENLEFLKEAVKNNLLEALLIYTVLTVISSVLLAVPGITFAVIAGVVFGPVLGTFACTVAATAGAVAAFIAGRFFLKDLIKPLAVKNKYLKEWLFSENKNKDFFILMLTRLIPLFPYNLQNFAYGTTDMKLGKYTLGTFIFILPGTAMYTLGAAGIADAKNRVFYISTAIVIAIFVFSAAYMLKKHYILTDKTSPESKLFEDKKIET